MDLDILILRCIYEQGSNSLDGIFFDYIDDKVFNTNISYSDVEQSLFDLHNMGFVMEIRPGVYDITDLGEQRLC